MNFTFFHQALFWALTLVAFFTAGGRAWAHPNLQNSMWVQFEQKAVRVAVNVSAKEISVAQEVPLGEGTIDVAALGRPAETHGKYVLSHLFVVPSGGGGKSLAGRIVNLTQPPRVAEADNTFFQYEIEYPLSGPPPEKVTLSHEMLKEWPYSAGTAWNISYVVRTKREGDDTVNSRLLPYQQDVSFSTGWQSSAQPVAAVTPSRWQTARDYLWHGFMHILTGYDHLLFVSALVIAALSFWEMAKVIAAFTLAHTLTLALSVFNIVRLPSSLVEPVIAASIVFVAVENIVRPSRAHSRARLMVAFGFGLIHGLGFAGGLLDSMEGLPSIGIWVALAAFSIGVELGHQVVVLPLFAIMSAGRKNGASGFQAAAQRYASALIACFGAYYLVIALR